MEATTSKRVTRGEIAREIGVSVQSIERWSDSGKFPAGLKLPGGHWVYLRSEVLRWWHWQADCNKARRLGAAKPSTPRWLTAVPEIQPAPTAAEPVEA